MWYFLWILGTIIACFLSIITTLFIEKTESSKKNKSK